MSRARAKEGREWERQRRTQGQKKLPVITTSLETAAGQHIDHTTTLTHIHTHTNPQLMYTSKNRYGTGELQ